MLTISKNLVWPCDLESFKGGNVTTLSLVDCYVQICNGTAVEHGSLLNCSGVCDGINCCKSVILFSGHPGISVNELSPLSLRR